MAISKRLKSNSFVLLINLKSMKIILPVHYAFAKLQLKIWEASCSEQALHFLSPLVNREKV